MFRPKNVLLTFLYGVKLRISKIKLFILIKLGMVPSVIILPYKGFGNEKEVYLVGRVIQDKSIGLSDITDNAWKNFRSMLKRFLSFKIPGVRIKADYGGMEQTVITDEEGYFEFRMKPKYPLTKTTSWQKVNLTLIDHIVPHQSQVKAEGLIYIPGDSVSYGVISDIDDTIISTGATRLWEMFKTTFFQNAHTRVPFPGVSAFYSALAKGNSGKESNPFFYVSSSPWNLYDFLMEFLNVHHIPKGPLMLRDLGLSREHFFSGSHSEHKLRQIEHILHVFYNIPFILIGDSGQEDPKIYLQVIKEFPGRVKMVYIRDVNSLGNEEIDKISSEIKDLGVEMLMVKDTLEAADHAASKGWIENKDIQEIANEKQKDELENKL